MAARLGEAQVIRPEVVTPRRDAVRLVHGEERNAQSRHRRAERGRAEPLGRDVYDLELTPADAFLTLVPLGIGERAVDEGGGDSPRGERVGLVLHQGDERRGDDGGPLEKDGGQLVADAL